MTTTATREQIAANKRWLQLQALDEQARASRAEVERLEGARREPERSISKATVPLQDYFEAVGAGQREPDAELEAELRAAAREAQGRVSLKPRQGIGGGLGVDVVDEAIEAQAAGARRLLEAAERAVAAHLTRHVAELGAELWPRTVDARDRFEERWGELRQAEAEWLSTARLWARLAEASHVDVAEIPANPLQGLGPSIDRGVPLPMPPSLEPREPGA